MEESSAASPVDDLPLNISELEEALDVDGAKEIAAGFLEDVSTVNERLTEALQNRDKASLKSTAHMLKGCCRIIFAHKTAALAASMEVIAMESKWDDAEKLMPSLLFSFYKTVNCLQKYLE